MNDWVRFLRQPPSRQPFRRSSFHKPINPQILPESTEPSSLFRSPAFSITELLVAIGLMVALISLAAPAVGNLLGAGDATKSAYTISGALEKVRAYAVAHNTYCWIGFFGEDANQPGNAGIGRILVAAVTSRDGTKAYLPGQPGEMDPQRLAPLGKLIRVENVALQSLPLIGIGEMGTRPQVAPNSSLASASDTDHPFQYPLIGPAQYRFTKIIEIDPRGEATLNSPRSNTDRWIEVGLEPTRGATRLASNPNFATIQMAVLTGQTKIFRIR